MDRSIIISNSSKLSMNLDNLIIKQNEKEFRIPVNDISYLYIEDSATSITVPLITKLTENGTIIVICNEKHTPSSYIIPNQGHILSTERQNLQLEASEKLKTQLWKQIISCKIENQRRVLRFNDKKFSKLKELDSIKQEGIASKLYFEELFGKEFRRRDEKAPNNYLNYGYSILRTSVIKQIVMSGLNPSLGLFHSNRSNSFTLADDFVEPFRPYIDNIVLKMSSVYKSSELRQEDKKNLLEFLNTHYKFKDKLTNINDIIKSMVISYIDCLKGDKRKLNLPIYEK